MRCSPKPRRPHGDNAPQPVRTLARLARSSRGARPAGRAQAERGLRFELAAYAKRLDGQRATLFPARRPSDPGGVRPRSDRGWMAEAMGVEPSEMLADSRTRRPIRCRGRVKRRPAQEVVHRAASGSREAPAAADPQRARRRALHRRRPADRAQSENRKAERHHPPLSVHGPEPPRRAGAAAPHLRLPPHGRGGGRAARCRDRRRRRSADAARLAGDRAARPRRTRDRRRAARPAAARGEMPRPAKSACRPKPRS